MGCISPKNITSIEAMINIDSKTNDTSYSKPITITSSFNKNYKQMPSSIKKIEEFFPSVTMLNEINEARSNPIGYIDKVIKVKKRIKTREDHQFYLDIGDSTIQIKLIQGIKAFDNCIEYLNKVHPQAPLKMKEDLKVPFPLQTPNICTDKDYLKNILIFKTTELQSSMKIIDFHYDICGPNPELSVILQIVDDTNANCQRRENIFNYKAKYVGITHGIINSELSCFYLMFSE